MKRGFRSHGAAVAISIGALVIQSFAHAQDAIKTCSFTFGGGQQTASVSTHAGQVTGFTWTYRGRKGSCDILGATFRPVDSETFIGRRGCQVISWQQNGRLTVSLSPATEACSSYCSSINAYEAILPMVFEANGQGCANR